MAAPATNSAHLSIVTPKNASPRPSAPAAPPCTHGGRGKHPRQHAKGHGAIARGRTAACRVVLLNALDIRCAKAFGCT